MKYGFYGASDVGSVHAGGRIYEGIDTPADLYEALTGLWCAETCAPRLRCGWNKDNPTLGQCSITAFLAQDIFGGEVFALPTDNGGVHCYNRVGDVIFDLTSEQFGEKAKELVYDCSAIQTRDMPHHFGKREKKERYEYLKGLLEKKMKG